MTTKEIVHPATGTKQVSYEADDATQPVTVHFHGGSRASTLLTEVDLEDAGAQDFEELVQKAITEPSRPHWCWIGGIYLFTQAISGIELADTTA